MNDIFEGRNTALSDPASRFASVTPSDTEDLDFASRAIYVGGAGDVALISVEGDEVIFSGVQAGSILPLRARRVKATATSATHILALW